MLDIDADFSRFFPALTFKLKAFQKAAVSKVLEQGNTLCIMPTGGGKSVIYWTSTLELQGICLVISPLLALIQEQSEKLRSYGYEVLECTSGMNAHKQVEAFGQLANGQLTPKFIFASPEKLATDGLLEYCLTMRREDIQLIVLDEVHCVSQWGISFRPFYARIPEFLDRLFATQSWCRVLALTATLNPKELSDVCTSFKIDKRNILRQELMMRSEIQLHVEKFADEDEKTGKFWDIIKMHRDEKILVYVYRKYKKRGVEDLCKHALDKGYRAAAFHGDMPLKERTKLVHQLKENEVKLIFATNAFGMGIDIPDIRVVVHFMIPESAEQYYQEVGRAARDGHGANAYLLYTDKNIAVKGRYFIDSSFPTVDILREIYKQMIPSPGYHTLPTFDNEGMQQCLPYYLHSGIIRIAGKGVDGLKALTDITDPDLQRYVDSTKSKIFIRTINVNQLTPDLLAHRIYKAFVTGKVRIQGNLQRLLILGAEQAEIDAAAMNTMLQEIEEKKKYKHELLDTFVAMLAGYEDSAKLHQEIAYYLGADKHFLGRIFKTQDGNYVRSKSEVIISNLLHNAGIPYEYEKKLYYGQGGQHLEPDFTVQHGDEVLFWEHVGLLGREDYDKAWLKKMDVYEKYFPGKLLKTYESGHLSQDAQSIIACLRA